MSLKIVDPRTGDIVDVDSDDAWLRLSLVRAHMEQALASLQQIEPPRWRRWRHREWEAACSQLEVALRR